MYFGQSLTECLISLNLFSVDVGHFMFHRSMQYLLIFLSICISDAKRSLSLLGSLIVFLAVLSAFPFPLMLEYPGVYMNNCYLL